MQQGEEPQRSGLDHGPAPTDRDREEPAPRPSLAGVVLDERYALEERIGAGGVGEIYRARHLRMERTFAVKLLPAAMLARPDFVERFDREAKVLSRLSHPCCVSVTDYGISDDYGPFIVMELLDGVPLSAYTRAKGLALATAIDLMIAVLAGLEHAHAQGIVHRDVKPDNIMVVERPLEPGRLMPKILDFGLAKIRAGYGTPVGASLTGAGLVIGTPHYLAPERITNPACSDDPRTDVYAAGVVLYEVCCGRRPFVDDDLLKVLRMHLTLPPPSPRYLRPSLPEQLEQVILRALEKQPADRFPSVAAFRLALEELPPLPEEIAGLLPDDPKTMPLPTVVPAPAALADAPPRQGWVAPIRALGLRLGRRPKVLAGAVVGALALIAVVLAVAVLSRGPRSPDAEDLEAAGAAAQPGHLGLVDEGSRSVAPPALRATAALWSNPRTRHRAGRQFMSYLAKHPEDAAAHVYVGRRFLYALWFDDGIKVLQRGLRADPTLRLDLETLVALTLAGRGAPTGTARRLIDTHAGPDAPRVVLIAAAVSRAPQIKRRLVADARRRGLGDDPLNQQLLDLAQAPSCDQRRTALRALGSTAAPSARVLLALLEPNDCLAADAKRLLAGSK